jgi:hypothetical protein
MIKPPAGPPAHVLVVALALVAGCNISAPKSGQPADNASQSATPATPATPAAAAAGANPSALSARRVAATCGPEIAGAADVIAPGTIVMLGEMHGSVEMPGFTGNLACRAAVAGHAVIVGLEIPRAEQAVIDGYLAGEGSAADRQALLRGEHWQRSYQDGRSSAAMVELIERARRLRKDGHAVEVLAFDTGSYDDWNARDAGMAAIILERAKARPDAFVVTLTGNLHNRTAPGLPWDASLVPMGVHVKAGSGRALGLNGLYEGGSTWMCEPDGGCGAREVGFKDFPYEAPAIDTGEGARSQGLDGIFFVGPLSPSPPAVPRAAAAPAQP